MKKSSTVNLPYFDHLLSFLQQDDEWASKSFGKHVHWGYWGEPNNAGVSVDEFATAAENLTLQVCSAAKLTDSIMLLDAGCGFGGTIDYVNKHYSGMNLVGLNIDVRQLHRAQQHVHAENENQVNWHQGNACFLPYQDNTFDVVLAVECIFHFPEREAFFSEVSRVLKPGGVLALSDFVPAMPLVPLAKLSLPDIFGVGFYGKCNVEYGMRQYRNLAEKTGFTVLQESDITKNTLPTYTYLRHLGSQSVFRNLAAAVETLTLEVMSRLGLMKYMVYAFKNKQGDE